LASAKSAPAPVKQSKPALPVVTEWLAALSDVCCMSLTDCDKGRHLRKSFDSTTLSEACKNRAWAIHTSNDLPEGKKNEFKAQLYDEVRASLSTENKTAVGNGKFTVYINYHNDWETEIRVVFFK
jgi:hypothetical protein